MKLKRTLLTMLVVSLGVSSFAQLSQRTNDSGNFKFGTRPQAGDMGINLQLYNASSSANFKGYFEEIPIVNLQYYVSDNTALRFGIRASKTKTLFKGEDEFNVIDSLAVYSAAKEKISSAEYMIYLGAEKHYALTNLLDVYVGAQVPVGYAGDISTTDIDLINGDYSYSTTKTTAMLYGLECFVGLQVFVADLPIAIGAEWGIAGYGKLGEKTHVMTDNKAGTVTTKQDYYTSSLDPTATQYKDVTASKFDMNSMVRFRVSYYFNR